jgi:hypothetical protein
MKLTVAAVILFTSVTTSFAGNFTPIPKNKVAQSTSCFITCQITFQFCLSVCGSACVSTSVAKPPVSRNCDFELEACQRGCLSSRSG